MTYSGRCYCSAIRFEVDGEPKDISLCHCNDCRLHSGAPVMAWAGFATNELRVTQGSPKTINVSGTAVRSFCGDCGTGLFYHNAELLPGMVEIQYSTFENPDALVPTMQVQTAERLGWMTSLHTLPAFERFPE